MWGPTSKPFNTMPADGSATLGAIIVKLAVVERLLWADEHPEAHALIAGAVQDLIALSHQEPLPQEA